MPAASMHNNYSLLYYLVNLFYIQIKTMIASYHIIVSNWNKYVKLIRNVLESIDEA